MRHLTIVSSRGEERDVVLVFSGLRRRICQNGGMGEEFSECRDDAVIVLVVRLVFSVEVQGV